MNENEQEQLPAGEVTEETETPEQENPDEPAEDLEQLRKDAKAFKDQRARAEKAEGELKKLRQTPPQSDLSPATQQRLDRIELTSLGVRDRDEQDFVLGAAKRLGVDPSEAANDEVVQGRLEKMREAKRTKEATPTPSRGSGSSTNITRLAQKALETGELPTDAETKAKVKAEMKKLSK